MERIILSDYKRELYQFPFKNDIFALCFYKSAQQGVSFTIANIKITYNEREIS